MSKRHLDLEVNGAEAPLRFALQDVKGHVVGGQQHDTVVVSDPEGVERTFELCDLGDGRAQVRAGDRVQVVDFARVGDELHVHINGRTFSVERPDPRARRRRKAGKGAGDMRSPMPGVISRVLVEAGDVVEADTPLYGLEAMKMESLIKAPMRLSVVRVLVEAGTQVEGGVDVVEVAPAETDEDDGAAEGGAS